MTETYVRHYDRLPASVGPHPAGCDWLGYLRYRDVNGPSNPENADSVIVAIPGDIAGARPRA